MTGRNASNLRGVWSCIYGDGGAVSLGTWSALKDILLSDNTNIDYRFPGLAHDGTVHRLVFLEDYSGGPVERNYKRPYLSFLAPTVCEPTNTFLLNYWREPYPFNLTCNYGLAIAKAPSKVFLTAPYGVWQAPLLPTPLDVSADVISLKQIITSPFALSSS